MSYSRQITTTDVYQEIACPQAVHVTGQITGGTVSIGFGTGGNGRPGAAVYPPGDEIYAGPLNFGFDRECDAIRLKSFTPGSPATVTLTALTDADG